MATKNKTTKEDFTEACSNWRGEVDDNGYAIFEDDSGSLRMAHEVAYTMLIGAIPDGKLLHRTCRNRRCVNWKHMQVVGQEELDLLIATFTPHNVQLIRHMARVGLMPQRDLAILFDTTERVIEDVVLHFLYPEVEDVRPDSCIIKTCDSESCWNPEHLRIVPPVESVSGSKRSALRLVH